MTAAAAAVPLQADPGPTVELALQLYDFAGAVLGLVIAAIAYRGYRRNDSRPMLFVAVGFVLALGVPLLLGVAYLLVGGEQWAVAVQVAGQTSELVGLGCILYGLWS